jgi:hypothetical protein
MARMLLVDRIVGRKPRRLLSSALVVACVAGCTPVGATERMQAVPLEGYADIPNDELLTHPAWDGAPDYRRFLERRPNNGAAPRYGTEVKVLFSRKALFIRIVAFDHEPQDLRAPRVRHDFVDRTQDYVAVYLDAAGKGKAAQFFRVSASGSTADGVHTAEDDTEDLGPDFEFDGTAATTASGYVAALRIPFTSLRYPRDPDSVSRIMILRRSPREESYIWASVPLPDNALSAVAQMEPIDGLAPPVDAGEFSIRPVVVARGRRTSVAGGMSIRESNFTLGAEIKWLPRRNVVVDATIRPDFSNVELDVPQLSGNTRFALSLPEKRPLFLESSDLLRSPTDALYTRAISVPRWGVRGTLRDEGLSSTAFVVRDAGGGVVLMPSAYETTAVSQPASTVVASRIRWDRGPLHVGAIASIRRYGENEGQNLVVGPDIAWQLADTLLVRAQVLASSTTALTDTSGRLMRGTAIDGARGYFSGLFRNDMVEVLGTLDVVTRNFRNDNGFLAQAGVNRFESTMSRIWRQTGSLNELWAYLSLATTQDRHTGSTIASFVNPAIYARWKNNSEATIEYRPVARQRLEPYGRLLNENYLHVNYSTTLATWIPKLSTVVDIGRLADIESSSVRNGHRMTLSARTRPLESLEVEPLLSMAALHLKGQTTYRESVQRVLVVWHLAPGHALRAIAQRTETLRIADPAIGAEGVDRRRQIETITYSWRRSAASSFYFGVGRNETRVAGVHSATKEAFAKVVFDF